MYSSSEERLAHFNLLSEELADDFISFGMDDEGILVFSWAQDGRVHAQGAVRMHPRIEGRDLRRFVEIYGPDADTTPSGDHDRAVVGPPVL